MKPEELNIPLFRQVLVEIFVQSEDKKNISKPITITMAWDSRINLEQICGNIAHYIERGEYGEYRERGI